MSQKFSGHFPSGYRHLQVTCSLWRWCHCCTAQVHHITRVMISCQYQTILLLENINHRLIKLKFRTWKLETATLYFQFSRQLLSLIYVLINVNNCEFKDICLYRLGLGFLVLQARTKPSLGWVGRRCPSFAPVFTTAGDQIIFPHVLLLSFNGKKRKKAHI